MVTKIQLVSDNDTIVFWPTPDVTGFVYDNITLDRWYALPSAEPKKSKRPNAHGLYNLGKTYVAEHLPIVTGRYYGNSTAEALVARDRLNALYASGSPITMIVTDELGEQTRKTWVLEVSTRFLYDFAYFPLDIAMIAPDPRRYGPVQQASDGMPTPGSGLVWNLGTSGSGLYFDWGTPGVVGQVSMTNTGNESTAPRFWVGGNGAFDVGFRITEIETGRELTLTRSTSSGDYVVLDSRTQRATIASGGGDVTAFLTSRQWFEIPARRTRRYQITPLGGYTGSPTFTIYASPASL